MEIEAPGMNNDNDAAQCLANEAQRYGRDQKAAAYYPKQLARQKRRYAKMKAKRQPIATGVAAKPWNDMEGEMVLHVCDSVKALLPKGSEYV